jgi:hypothetical protein
MTESTITEKGRTAVPVEIRALVGCQAGHTPGLVSGARLLAKT